jgi:hypothetical protein
VPQLLDFDYIRKNIPIVEVASELGLAVNGYSARCWRVERHRNGDANPSIGFRKKQNTWRCFVCDQHTSSNINLVMGVRNCGLREATAWIAARFDVPELPKGAHIEKRKSWSPRFRASDFEGNVVAMLVRSGLWSKLAPPEHSLIAVICSFVVVDSTESVPISYRGLMRHSGVGSSATVSAALKHFQQMGFLQIVRANGEQSLRAVNRYRVTVDCPEFQDLLTRTFKQQREETDAERQMQAQARKARRQSLALHR